MSKSRTKFVCQQCSFETLRWMGKCPECGAWNSMLEEKETAVGKNRTAKAGHLKPVSLQTVEQAQLERLDLGMSELNRVLGGGLVPGTIVLLAGDPGIGKSTLLLQAAAYTARQGRGVLYISGEESAQQIKLRSARLGLDKAPVLVWTETDMEMMAAEIENRKPDLVIVDSIQTVHSGELDSVPGSVSQIREATVRLMALAKSSHTAVVIIGHVTKDGNIAGPRVLEHMVDTVLYFEGERHYQYRLLRAMKNRFGSTFELGVFEMQNEGLAEVLNPSRAFLAEKPPFAPGSVVAACLEGSRPLMVEIQALVCSSTFGQPRRIITGTDYNRVNLLMAMLEKRVGLALSSHDAYVNVVGGIKILEPALDLTIATAIASSFKNRPCLEHLAVMGEVGLTGEVRGVPYIQQRLQEAKKLGFTHCIIPHSNYVPEMTRGLEVLAVRTVAEALEMALL